jgi:Icc-related predicted phosphoesterase
MRGFGKGKRNGASERSRETLVFFATDIHGSDICFKKFLNAGKFYGATHLIVGGDITGKSLVPIRQSGERWTAYFANRDHVLTTRQELDGLVRAIRDDGQYPLVAEQDELNALADEGHRAKVFTNLVVDGMQRWMDLADQRLEGTGISCYLTPGNDDFWELDPVIEASHTVQYVEGRCVRIDDRHEMVTTGYSNVTPWRTERELSEEDLAAHLESLWEQVTDPSNVVAVIHVPPLGTGLDLAPELTADLSMKMTSGGLTMTHVGSSAVRTWIERHQPLCGLFGHAHESKAAESLGRTICLNPGSEYTSGVLTGALLALGDGRVSSYQFVTG